MQLNHHFFWSNVALTVALCEMVALMTLCDIASLSDLYATRFFGKADARDLIAHARGVYESCEPTTEP